MNMLYNKDRGIGKFHICFLLGIIILTMVLPLSAKSTLTQDQFYNEIKRKGIDREKSAVDFTDDELTEIAKLLPKRFSDINGDEWYIRDLALLASKGVVNGYGSDGKRFAGLETTSRSEFWAMQGRLQGIDGKVTDKIKAEVKAKIEGSNFDKTYSFEWYNNYYFYQNGIPFGIYTNEEMIKPVYRGEVATLIYEYLAKSESTNAEIISMADKKYFTDIPTKLTPIFESEKNSDLHKVQDSIIGFSTPYYYPKFTDIVNGKQDMLEVTKVAINWCNKVGIMCGLPDGTSGWNNKLTRAEAVATLARAFRTANRLPVEKRKQQ